MLHGSRVLATPGEADKLAADLRTKISTRRRTVEDAIAEFRLEMDKRVERNEMRMESARNAENALRKIHEGALDSALGALTERRAGELYETLMDEGGKASTQHRFLRTARAFGDWLVKRHWAKVNAWANVEQKGERDDSRDVVLRGTEAAGYREAGVKLAQKGDHGALAALLPLVCGLSPIEIVQIEARDVDEGGAVLWIAGARLKTKNRRRNMDVLDENVAALLAKLAVAKPEGPIFGELTRDEVTAAVRRVAAAAGLKQAVDARTMRRTFATLGARRGASLDQTAYSLGHGADGNARTAQSYYLEPGAAQSGQARRVLGVLDGGKSKTSKRSA